MKYGKYDRAILAKELGKKGLSEKEAILEANRFCDELESGNFPSKAAEYEIDVSNRHMELLKDISNMPKIYQTSIMTNSLQFWLAETLNQMSEKDGNIFVKNCVDNVRKHFALQKDMNTKDDRTDFL